MQKLNVPLETEEQRNFVAHLERIGVLFYAVPNEGKRSRWAAQKMKAEGMKPGVPDIVICHARGGYHGLYIELKRRNSTASALRPNQREWKENLEAQGYRVEVCKGAMHAADVVADYIKSGITKVEK